MFEQPKLSGTEVRKLKAYYAKRWIDPVNRIEDIYNVRRADGSLTKYMVPEPQKKMIRDGILGKSRELVGTGVSYVGVTNKGRQLGFSVILAAEAILIAEEFPGTFIYYVATASDQASDWMMKLDQLCRDANHWPTELGGGPILNVKNIEKVFEKNINGTYISGLAANPSTIRGKTGIVVIFDEAAWAIRFKGQAKETWKALKYIIRQGGQARIQSTPRLSDEEEFFWGMLKKGEAGSLAIHTYYCPVITNWKELDLNEPLWIDLDNKRREMRGLKPISEKDITNLIKRYKPMPSFEVVEGKYIKQDANIPYWWVSIQDLETDRAADLEQFKQENLGIPLDETYKLIQSEWIYSNLNEGEEYDSRPPENNNKFYCLIDLAQINDITAITIVEEIPQKDGRPIYVERRIEETQEKYPVQVAKIFDFHEKFRFITISIDNTGHGIVIGDYLEEKLRENGMDLKVLKRVNFGAGNKEEMAIGFRNIVMPDAITGKSRYKWLYKQRKHEDAIRHCMRVEKIVMETFIRYSGKMHGRDDHFWSKAQIALLEKPSGVPKAAKGKIRKAGHMDDRNKMTYGKAFLAEMDKRRWAIQEHSRPELEKANKLRNEKVRMIKNTAFALQCLTMGVVICRTEKRPVQPIHCAWPANCNDPHCPGYKYVEEICQRYEVEKNELWKRQTTYPRE